MVVMPTQARLVNIDKAKSAAYSFFNGDISSRAQQAVELKYMTAPQPAVIPSYHVFNRADGKRLRHRVG